MLTHPKIDLFRLRTTGWRLWDPIGLASPGGKWPEDAVDEYDRYLLHAANMMCDGHTREEASLYFVQIASDHMRLLHVDRDAATATANAIADYLESLTNGPKVR